MVIDVNRKIKGPDVVEVLRYLFAVRGEPEFIRSDNDPEFISEAVKKFLRNSGIDTLYIEPGSPWENSYVESFNSKLRDELLNRELFLHIDELRYVADRWRIDYNHYRRIAAWTMWPWLAFAAKYLEQGSALLKTRRMSAEYSHNNWYKKQGQATPRCASFPEKSGQDL